MSASLEEQIFRSNGIVRATLLSASTSTQTIPSDPGVAPTYQAVHELRFMVHEYLKGSGPNEIVVVVRDDHAFVSEADARRRAEVRLSERNTTWDDREGILFLRIVRPHRYSGPDPLARISSGSALEFTLTNPFVQTPWDYSIDTLSRVWLPSTRRPDMGDSEELFITDGSRLPQPSVSLGELRSKIAKMETTLAAGEGIEGYLVCIELKIAHERHRRVQPWTPTQFEATIASGLAAGEEVDRRRGFGGDGYDRFRLTGPDADLFLTSVTDVDKNPKSGFVNLLSVARPLPAGTYRFQNHWQHHSKIPCNNVPDDTYTEWTVTVKSPLGTAHEAFFDPGAVGAAVGADGTNGVLESAAFTVGGANSTIAGLEWESGVVTMKLSPSASLAGHGVDFIALDGSVSLTLSFDDATRGESGALTWSVPNQPWSAGDLLMLRVSAPVLADGN